MAKGGDESGGGTRLQGLVVRNTGNTYLIRDDSGNKIPGIAKGNLRLKGIRSTSPIVVGDRVFMTPNPDGTAFITDIAERKNCIVRKASNLSRHTHILAANIDLAYLCVTVNRPKTTTVFIDRFLAVAEAYSVPVCLIFNKIDLYDSEEHEYANALIHLYSTVGYRCLKTSAVTGEGKDRLEALAAQKTVLLAGHSGVGKSSIVNLLLGSRAQRVREISGYHHKGMHTTTFSEMIELKNGGLLIDTPGIKGFGTVDMDKAEVSHYFPEIFRISENCKYNNCLHLSEPGCAVTEAVANHHISRSRYHSYLNMLEDVEEGKYRL
ncbi:MAG: ribosome small subunit-dependent GTPase A [Proteiniphilum sp.]|jgi:ribosome biogenesis GTPase|nr:ribosome small subunit-dependent GTPase A [Proteiniphilum sp.]